MLTTGFVVGRLIYQVPIPIERVIVFPMAVIPHLWGLWNMLYVRLRVRWHIPIGIYGAALVLLIAPLGFAVAALLGFQVPHRITRSPRIASGTGGLLSGVEVLGQIPKRSARSLLGVSPLD